MLPKRQLPPRAHKFALGQVDGWQRCDLYPWIGPICIVGETDEACLPLRIPANHRRQAVEVFDAVSGAPLYTDYCLHRPAFEPAQSCPCRSGHPAGIIPIESRTNVKAIELFFDT